MANCMRMESVNNSTSTRRLGLIGQATRTEFTRANSTTPYALPLQPWGRASLEASRIFNLTSLYDHALSVNI